MSDYLYLHQSYRDKNGRVNKKMIKYICLESKSKHPDLQNKKRRIRLRNKLLLAGIIGLIILIQLIASQLSDPKDPIALLLDSMVSTDKETYLLNETVRIQVTAPENATSNLTIKDPDGYSCAIVEEKLGSFIHLYHPGLMGDYSVFANLHLLNESTKAGASFKVIQETSDITIKSDKESYLLNETGNQTTEFKAIPANLTNETGVAGNITNESFLKTVSLSTDKSLYYLNETVRIKITAPGNTTTNLTIEEPMGTVYSTLKEQTGSFTHPYTPRYPGNYSLYVTLSLKNETRNILTGFTVPSPNTTENQSTAGNISYQDIQEEAEVGRPVGWLRKIEAKNISIITPLSNSLPEDAFNISTQEKEGEILIHYYTPAPWSEEKILSSKDRYIKRITVVSDTSLHYRNVKVSSTIGEIPSSRIGLYWLINDSRQEVTKNPGFNVTLLDENNNGIPETITWIIPEMSKQTFEVEMDLVILNIQSYPMLYGNWTVRFETQGRANLTIKPVEGTTWGLTGSDTDLQFLGIRCGNQTLSPEWLNDSVFVPNYSCSETGYEISRALTSGKHALRFQFGSNTGYAYNTVTSLTLGSPLNNTQTLNNQSGFAFTPVSDVNTSFSCELFIDDVGHGVNGSVQNGTETTIQANSSLSDGDHMWYVNCTDASGTTQSETRVIGVGSSFSRCAVLIDAGAAYHLTADIINSSTPYCVNISANNVTLDCQDHMIDGDDIADYGIYLHRSSATTTNVTIKNCVVTDWFAANVYLENAGGNRIQNVISSSSPNNGIFLESGNNNTFINNTMNLNGDDGILIWGSCSNTTFINNTLNNNADCGIHVFSGLYYSTFISNTVNNNSWCGIYLFSGSNNTLTNNTVNNNNNYGIILDVSSSNNTLTGNSISNTMGYGIDFNHAASGGANKIYNNLFNNTNNFQFSGTIYTNYWNTTKQAGTRIHSTGNQIGGNYWTNSSGTGYSDTCTDADKDGFCDEQYNLTSDGKNIDYLPLSDESICDYYINSVPYTISNSNSYYCLNTTATNLGATAITFSSGVQNTTLDGRGFNLDGWKAQNSRGVYLTGSATRNNTIRNCYITEFDYGINLNNGPSNNTLTNNTVNSNRNRGILLSSSSSNTITNNTLNLNGWFGIALYYSSSNTLTNNIIKESSDHDIYLYTSSDAHCNNLIENNTGSGDRPIKYYNSSITLTDQVLSELILCNADYSNITNVTINGSATRDNNGLLLYHTDNANLTSISSNYNDEGIQLIYSSNNTFTNVDAKYNGWVGIYLVEGNFNNNFTNITLSNIDGQGIYIELSSYNTFTDMTVSNNNYNGIYFSWEGHYNTFTNVIASNNTYHGILLYGNSNVFTNVTANNNGYDGISIFDSSNNTLNSNTFCNNHGSDIYLDYGANNNTGDNNTCYSPYYSPLEWSDTGTTGCTYSCPCDGYYLTVCKSGSCNSTTIQDGMNRVCENGTIYVNDTETYNEGIAITKYNLTLNCNKATINGSGGGTGIKIRSKQYTTVKNCVVQNFNTGIYPTYSSYNTLINNIVNSNGNGIRLRWHSRYNTLINCTANSNSDYGFELYSSSSYNTLTNNTANSNGGTGIAIQSSSYNNLTNNIANNNNYNGIYLISSSHNNLTNNTANNNKRGILISWGSGYNNITGGSIADNTFYYDYYLRDASSTNSFKQTGFTSPRKIYFQDTTSWFIYNNQTTNGIWLKTSLGTADRVITRKLTSWTQSLVQWNDSGTVTANYELSGLMDNIDYTIYDNSMKVNTLTTDSSGVLPQFSINLASEHEIKVESACDYYINPEDLTSTYNITESNKYYCLNTTTTDLSYTAIQFNEGVQNTTLDCRRHTLDGDDIADYGIYLHRSSATTTDITIKNCVVTDWDTANVYLENASRNIIQDVISTSSPDRGFYLNSSHSNYIINCTANYNNDGFYLYFSNATILNCTANNNSDFGFEIEYSNSSIIKNCIANNHENSYGFGIFYSNSNNIINCSANNSGRDGFGIFYSNSNNITNSTATYNFDDGFYLYQSNSNTITGCTATNTYPGGGFFIRSSNSNTITNSLAKNNEYYGICLFFSSNNTLTGNLILNTTRYGIELDDAGSVGENRIYNNLFNNTVNFLFSPTIYNNNWNTTKQSGARIYSDGNEIGGNYWTNSTGDGYSDTCNDTNEDGFCDKQYNLTVDGKNSDYLPLSNEYGVAPITTATAVKADGTEYTFNTWTNSTYVNVALSCDDGSGSGCNVTLYCTDTDNSCTPTSTYSTPVQISTEGTSYIRFRSNDTLGNLETINNQIIKIDTSAPTTTASAVKADGTAYTFNTWTNSTYVNVTLGCSDSSGSGYSIIQYCTDLFNSCTPNLTYGPNWWNSSWSYRREINISNTAENLTNYQVNVVHNFSTEYSAGKINTTCKDIRFTYYDATVDSETEIPFWLETCDFSSSDNMTAWVNVTHLENNSDTTIYMYYGNPTAASASNGTNTFMFFDDFSTDTDSQWNKYTDAQSHYYCRSIGQTLTAARLRWRAKLHDENSRNWAGAQFQGLTDTSNASAMSNNYAALRSSYNTDSGASNTQPSFRFYSRNGTTTETDGSDTKAITEGNTYLWELVFSSSNAKIGVWDTSGVSRYSRTLSNYPPNQVGYHLIRHYDYHGDGSCTEEELRWYSGSPNYLRSYCRGSHYGCDSHIEYHYYWMFVSGYAFPEPGVSNIGAEENPSVIQISTEGTSYIRFRSNDTLGNLETTKNETIKINTTLPVDFTLSPPDILFSDNSPTAGDNIIVTATVHNLGNAGYSGFAVALLVDGVAEGINTLSIGGNSTNTTGFSWTAVAGTHDITISVDPAGDVAEINESNNNATRQITVSSPPSPPSSSDDMFMYTNGSCVNQSVTVTVLDEGSDPVSGVEVRIYFDGSRIEDLSTNAHGETSFVPGEVGDYELRARRSGYRDEDAGLTVISCEFCLDGVMNQNETDVDCGGSCPPCGDGGNCSVDSDCVSGWCYNGTCRTSTCGDGIRGPGEQGVDCGGSCPPCGDGGNCSVDSDCVSGWCYNRTCRTSTCGDGIRGPGEQGVDCGGPCLPCHCFDGVRNFGEGGVDCGGGCPPCITVRRVTNETGTGETVVVFYNVTSLCLNNRRDVGETDVDCGGHCPPCDATLSCLNDSDCMSGWCYMGGCRVSTCMDGILGPGEEKIDCGGPCGDCPWIKVEGGVYVGENLTITLINPWTGLILEVTDPVGDSVRYNITHTGLSTYKFLSYTPKLAGSYQLELVNYDKAYVDVRGKQMIPPLKEIIEEIIDIVRSLLVPLILLLSSIYWFFFIRRTRVVADAAGIEKLIEEDLIEGIREIYTVPKVAQNFEAFRNIKAIELSDAEIDEAENLSGKYEITLEEATILVLCRKLRAKTLLTSLDLIERVGAEFRKTKLKSRGYR